MTSIITSNINSYMSNILNVQNTNSNVEKNKDIKIGIQLALQKNIRYPQKAHYNSVIPLNIYDIEYYSNYLFDLINFYY